MAAQAATVTLRAESDGDADAIALVTRRAFDGAPHSDGSEADIIDRLRQADALTISLVAVDDGEIVGHLAISPVEWQGVGRWAGLGPISVEPNRQGAGIGSALIRRALSDIQAQGFDGCVVLGDPRYYQRFGFRTDSRLFYPGPPPEYFMALAFRAIEGSGAVRYHPAFG